MVQAVLRPNAGHVYPIRTTELSGIRSSELPNGRQMIFQRVNAPIAFRREHDVSQKIRRSDHRFVFNHFLSIMLL
jgi:hypothetical protein